ncbi:MAG: c-type cytochrome [Anaerolineales bacterium]|nr:c-type cytochrome [Anaerolineales bacterium]
MNRANLEILLGTIFVVFTAIALIVYGLEEENRMARYSQGQQAEAIEVGAYLFELNCSECHGDNAEGRVGLAPALNDRYFFTERLNQLGWAGTMEDYIQATISSGRITSTRPNQYAGYGVPAMPAWSENYGGPLRMDQIRAITAFIMNFEPIALGEVVMPDFPTPMPPPEEEDDPFLRGRRVFLDMGCAGCHALEGISVSTIGPPLNDITTVAETRIPELSAEEYIRQSILFPRIHTVEGYPDIMPEGFGDRMTEQQFEDLIFFLMEQE